jgi:hypothetical protein
MAAWYRSMFSVPTLDYFGSCGAHFFDGFLTVARL